MGVNGIINLLVFILHGIWYCNCKSKAVSWHGGLTDYWRLCNFDNKKNRVERSLKRIFTPLGFKKGLFNRMVRNGRKRNSCKLRNIADLLRYRILIANTNSKLHNEMKPAI